MSEYFHVEKPFLDQLAALGWTVIDQGQGFIPCDPTASLRDTFREWHLPEVFRDVGRGLLLPFATLDQPMQRLNPFALEQGVEMHVAADIKIHAIYFLNRPDVGIAAFLAKRTTLIPAAITAHSGCVISHDDSP